MEGRTQMTPLQINTAIAELRGYTDCHCSLAQNTEREPHERCLVGIPPNGTVHHRIPDCYGDLYAMHEAEVWLTANRSIGTFWEYAARLKSFAPHPQTSAQRAEVLLRTLGRWVEAAR